MSTHSGTPVDEVKGVLLDTLGLQDRADQIGPDTPLFETLPELDSMAVLEVLTVFEARFGVEIDGEAVTAEAFETPRTLTAFVDSQRG